MKQTITKKQWDELDNKQKKKLFTGLTQLPDNVRVNYEWLLIGIGQMIEFLYEEEKEYDCFIDRYFHNQIHFGFDGDGLEGCNSKISIGWDDKEELCDALWEVCKSRLLDKENSK